MIATPHQEFSKRKFGNVEAPKVLLTDTTSFPGGVQLAISLAKAGCDVSAVCPIGHHLFSTVRAVRQKFLYSPLNSLGSLTAAIERVQPEIIIPCDDVAVQHLHELYAHASNASLAGIAALIERSLGSPQSYRIVGSRYDFLQLVRQEDLRVPETSLINTLDDLNTCPVDQTHPVVLKADGTWGGNGVRIARTTQQAREYYAKLTHQAGMLEVARRLLLNRDRFWLHTWASGAKPEIVGQKFIAGRPANCAAFCWKGRVLAEISVEVVSTRKQNGPASVVRVIDRPEMRVAAERIARRLQISGFFGLDFMIEDDTEAAYLIEMNPRCTRLSHLQLGTGRDMVAALWSTLTGRSSLHDTPPVTRNNLIAFFPDAWISKSEYLSRSFHDIPASEPALVRELLKDSSDRTLLSRLIDHLRRGTRADSAPSGKHGKWFPHPAATPR